jgi:predicted RNase H-like HicB family nuclease
VTGKKKSSFAVKYERDEAGWWIASVAALPGCHIQGRTLDQARRRIAEAMAMQVEEPKAQLEEHILLKPKLRRVIDQARAARLYAEKQQAAALQAMRSAVVKMIESEGLSIRDAGQLLGLSHQRVHQLLHAGGDADDRQPLVREAAQKALGAVKGGNLHRSEMARKEVRKRIRKQHGR